MFAWNWILRKLFSPSSRPARKPIRRRVRPELEKLEDRTTPAVIWTVNLTTDAGGPNGQATGQNTGDLRYCATHAAAGDTIDFAAALNGQTIQLNSQIMLTQTNLTIIGQDPNQNPLDVSISGGNGFRIFEVQSGNDSIQNLTFTGGTVIGANGGAILVDNGATLNLNNDYFLRNGASILNGVGGYGGAIANYGALIDSGSTFSTNGADSGGAIYNIGQFTESGSAYFINNQAAIDGGAIESNGGGQGELKINNSFFYSNLAAFSGGAIETWDNTTLSNDTFGGPQAWQANIANNGNGGAIQNYLSATLTSDQFLGNQASNDGGAIENAGGSLLKVNTTTFEGNTAGAAGGAIQNLGITNIGGSSILASNTAGTNGGAIDSENGTPTGQLVVSDSLLYGNTAQKGTGGPINTTDNTLLTGDGFGVDFLNNPQAPNTANVGGGAVSADPGISNSAATLTVLGCGFLGNKATSPASPAGGAIDTADVTDVEYSQFVSNQASLGGAIDYGVTNDSTTPATFSLTVNQDFFQNNAPPTAMVGEGGAIESMADINAGTSTVSITNSTFYVNGINPAGKNTGIAGTGGGANIRQTTSGNSSASTTLTNDTFFQNTADSSGGGIALFLTNTSTGTNTAALTSLTVNGNNTKTDSAGLYVNAGQNGVVSVDNSILSGNTVAAANYNGPVDVTLTNNNALNDLGYNLVGTSDTMFTAKTDPAKTDNPGLAQALAANGALPGYIGQTLALNNNSPALGAGDPKLANKPAPLGIDERGLTRQVGKVSIGAEDPGGVVLKVGQSSTSVDSSLNPALVGQPVTFTAAVTAAGDMPPTGTVTFTAGSTQLGTAPVDDNGNATITTYSLPLGSTDITATYSGDSNYSGSSGSLTQVISQEEAVPSIYLTSSANPAIANQPLTLNAGVSGDYGTPTGTVTFLTGNSVIGTASVVNGTATLTTSTLPLGDQTITANYSGDATYNSSTETLDQTVAYATPSVYLSSSANPALVNQPLTLNLNVSGDYGAPTGTVTFLNGNNVIGTAAVVNGNATLTTSTLPVGNLNLQAVYSGDATYANTTATMSETVQQGVAYLYLSSNNSSSQAGQTVTFNANVSSESSGGPTPTGSVTFYDGSTPLCTVNIDGSGNASLSISTLAIGDHNISAVYSGDATFGATSSSMTQTVNANYAYMWLYSSNESSQAGEAVTFTANLNGGNYGTPTGSVNFYDGGTFIGSGVLDGNGNATFTTSSLSVGSHTITAEYDGDNLFGSSSGSMTQTVS